MSALYDVELTPLLQNAGEYIVRLRPAEERIDWMIFLVDQIQPFLSAEEFDSFLHDLQRAVAARCAGNLILPD